MSGMVKDLKSNSIVIVGNGCASAECIKALRSSGYNGEISLINDTGWPVFNPMLIPYYLLDQISFDELFPYGRGREFYRRFGVDIYFESPATDIDIKEKFIYTGTGKRLRYKKLLIATGAYPILPPLKGIYSNRVFTVRTVEDTIRLKNFLMDKPNKALIIGASLIGVKIAEVFHKLNIEVCLVDIAPHVFPLNAHTECAKRIEDHLVEKGIILKLGKELVELKEKDKAIRAYFKDGEKIETEIVIICIGVKPNIKFINRGEILVDRGILIDEYMKTNIEDIYAAGDVTQNKTLLPERSRILGLLNIARYQGRIAGKNMAGKIACFEGMIPHNIAHFMDIDFISIGDINCYDRIEIKENKKRFIQLFWNDRFLTGINILGSCEDSGIIKNVIIKNLLQKRAMTSDKMIMVQDELIKNILGGII